ncbi:dual oxidase-like [Saccoglossus kowalevskii]
MMTQCVTCIVLFVGLIGSVHCQTSTVDTPTTRQTDESIYSERHVEYAGYDGWYNNRAHPEWGAVEMPLTRRLPSAYKDGVYMPIDDERPNPLTISEETMKGPTGKGSLLNRTALMVFFGQQVVEEILDAQRPGCPPEYYNIEVPDDHPLYEKGYRVMPFVRSRYDMGNTGFSPNNPRQQLNEITPYIDGGLMYGTSKAWADALRSFEGGRLAKSEIGNFPAENDIGLPMANPPAPADHKLKDAKRFFKLGNPRGNENPFLLTFGILWFRWHNYLADDIAAKHPSWSDERIFNEARKWVIATHQKIVLYDWLPAFLNLNESRVTELRDNYAYSSAIHPGVTHVFQSAAMRIGHTLVPPGVFRRNSSCDFRKTTIKSNLVPNYQGGHEGVRTCNSFWNPQLPILETDIDEFLMGMASQICEREDNIITEDLRGKVFGPLEFSRRDLMALNIQRGRDHGLPDYNTARREYNLAERANFRDINPNLPDDIVERLAKVHDDDITKLDIWTGGLMETDINGPGELFHTIILDQFIRIRDGDRFWYENRKNNLFTEQEIAEINSITLYDIIVKTSSSISEDDIQKDKFNAFKRYIENYRMHIFWMTLYLLVLLGIFIERAYYYSVEREHAGLRRIAGYGVTVTRGAASAQMFTYSTLLVTMCRNTITFLRDTVLNRYIPFDSAITFHKVVAMLALFFTLLHTIGHSINFYHISSQPANDLTCYFREFKHLSHELPKFHYWCWETITGLTGVALLLLVFIMYVFATQYARRHVFTWFWNTHQLYVLLYLLMILHGCGRLVQFPIFYLFFVGPAVLFTFDKLISISRKKSEIAVVKAELLPSEVTSLVFKRPIGFEYKSGQWVRIACIVLGDNEYHPFTLTSAPHEEHLMLHIRAVGPWTTNIRQTYDPNVVRDHPFPKTCTSISSLQFSTFYVCQEFTI